MKIGIIGLGVVGSANASGFRSLGHEVIGHDIKHNTVLQDIIDTEVVFICTHEDHVEGVVQDLTKINYNGIVCIRSTVLPGFTERMIDQYSMTICCSPEFLHERKATEDFINNHKLLAVGTKDKVVYNKIVEAHGDLPKATRQLSPTEAEILKYFNNTFASLRIVFANVFYELSQNLGCDYTSIKNAYIETGKTVDLYLDVNSDLRGYGGMCLPKDTQALALLLDQLGLDFDLIKSVHNDNNKLKTTVFDGMRK